MRKLLLSVVLLAIISLPLLATRGSEVQGAQHHPTPQAQQIEVSHSSFPLGICRGLNISGWYLGGPYLLTSSYFDGQGNIRAATRVLEVSGFFGSTYTFTVLLYAGQYFRDAEFVSTGLAPHTANFTWSRCVT